MVPIQRIHSHTEICFGTVDGSTWSEEFLHDRLVEDSLRPFDLEHGPLLRVSLYTRAADEHVLLVAAHHIAIDLLSFKTVLDDLNLFYPSEKANLDAPLSHSDYQYSHFVSWQIKFLSTAEGERHRQPHQHGEQERHRQQPRPPPDPPIERAGGDEPRPESVLRRAHCPVLVVKGPVPAVATSPVPVADREPKVAESCPSARA